MKIKCDCCGRNINDFEQLFTIEISKGIDKEIVLNNVCVDCYDRFKHIINNAKLWCKSN